MKFRILKKNKPLVVYFPQYQAEDDEEWKDMHEDGSGMSFDKMEDAKMYIFRTIKRGHEPIPDQEIVWTFTPTEQVKHLLEWLQIGEY